MFLMNINNMNDMGSVENKIDEYLFLNEVESPCLVVGTSAFANFKQYNRDNKNSPISECHCIVESLLANVLKVDFPSGFGDICECNFLGLMYGRFPIFAGKIQDTSVYFEEMNEELIEKFLRLGLKK